MVGLRTFRILVQVHRHRYSFTFSSKGYDNHKWAWSVNDVMSGSDGPENLKILKKSQLGFDLGQCRKTVALSAIEAESWSWGLTIMVRSWVRQCCWEVEYRPWFWDIDIGPWNASSVWVLLTLYDYEILLRIVSLLVSKNRTHKIIIKRLYVNERVRLCFCLRICTVVIDGLWLCLYSNRYITIFLKNFSSNNWPSSWNLQINRVFHVESLPRLTYLNR